MEEMDRRGFIKSGLKTVGALAAINSIPASMQSCSSTKNSINQNSKINKPNILLIITDQQRQARNWPKNWVENNLPSMNRLMKNGITFTNACTAASQCSPSRASFMTGTYPDIHGVYSTPPFSPNCLKPKQENICRMMQNAGYETAYKGKWHMTTPFSNPSEFSWTQYDIDYLAKHYQLFGWDAPDAGVNLIPDSTLGAGTPNNDKRFVSGMQKGPTKMIPGLGTSAIDFLNNYNPASEKPFFLIVSLVNPHDINIYPKGYDLWGYHLNDFKDLDINLPKNYKDSLKEKPSVQTTFLNAFNKEFPIKKGNEELIYTRFYAYLHKLVDDEITTVLNKLDERGLTDNTLTIRFSDHGEMGMSHGLRQKMFNAYSETINIPLIISNPILFPKAKISDAMVSSIDLAPTLGELAGIPQSHLEKNQIYGKSIFPIIKNTNQSTQDSVLFTYEDHFTFNTDDKPARIRCIRKKDYMYSVYYSKDGKILEYEFYNLKEDPYELTNLAYGTKNIGYRKIQQSLHDELTQLLKTYKAFPKSFHWPTKTGRKSI